MQRQWLQNFIVKTFPISLTICFLSYFLQPISDNFVWVFWGTVVLNFYLFLITIGFIFEFLTIDDD